MVVGAPDGTKSIRDVAARAGVSVGTVSNVLNRPEQVAPATRARVEQAIAALGFVRNESARQLRAGRSRTLGLVVLDVSNPFFTDVARGVEDAATAAGLAVILCNSDEKADRERRYLDLLEEHRVQGILITPVKGLSDRLRQLQRRTALTVVQTPALNFSSGLAAGARIATMPSSRRPTAAFCANDLVALGVLQEMTRRKLRVPGDLAIVGYDDIDFAAAAAVPLSSVRQPRDQLGRAAAQLLVQETSEGRAHSHRQMVFEPQLVARDSSDQARPGRRRPGAAS